MRRLAIMSAAFSAGIFIANFILPTAWLIPCGLILAVLGCVALFVIRSKRNIVAMALISLALGVFCFRGAYVSKALPAQMCADDEVYITARILSYPSEGRSCLKAEALLCTEDMPSLRAMIYDYDGRIASVEPGYTYTLTADISPADTMYGEDYQGYYSKNVFLILKPTSEPVQLSDRRALSSLPARFSHWLCERADEVFPDDCAPFVKSLVVGNKTDFYTQNGLRLDFGRAGLMHIVAISGMHVSMLVGMIFVLLGRNKRNNLICLVLTWFFVFAVGAPASACRAAVMQSCLLIAPLFGKENDSITSLFASLAILLAANPYSCANTGLQLSFASILGIILFSERLTALILKKRRKTVCGRLVSYIVTTISASLSATVFTLPLMAIHFGYFSILAPLANILCLWAISFCFGGGLICCLIGAVFLPAARVIAFPLVWLMRYLFAVVGLVSDIPYCALYTSTPAFAVWIVSVILLIGLAYFARVSPRLRLLAPLIGACFTLIMSLTAVKYLSPANDGMISVIDVGQGQCICLTDKNTTVLIDCGNISSPDNAGELAKAYLESIGRRRVNALILTHDHTDHSSGAETLLELEQVDIIYKLNSNDSIGIPEQASTDVVYITNDTLLSFGDITLDICVPEVDKSDEEQCMIIDAGIGETRLLITGDSSAKVEKQYAESHDLASVDVLIVGHHGSKYSSSDELLSEIGGGTAIISTGHNTYGHPTYETLARLEQYGYNILRTDLNGTVEISSERG